MVHLAGDKTGFFLSLVSSSTAFSAPGLLLCIFYQARRGGGGSHFYIPWKVLNSLWSLCYPWHCWHFISSWRCWAAGGYGWPSMRHLKLQRNDVTSSWFQTVVFTAMLGWEPGLEPGTLVASICCSCLLWQISSPARMVWLLQDLDFHFNNPKTSLDSAEELNLNM